MNQIIDEAQDCDLVWIGEVHGIQENYQVYKTLLPALFDLGFDNLLWEMPSGFNENSKNSEDGKINPYAVDFLRWLEEQKKSNVLKNFGFFGQIYEFSDYERSMADQLKNILETTKSKTIVLTGNYHLKNKNIKSAQEYIGEETKLKILKIELGYSGGTFYNYGIKTIRKLNDAEPKFGEVSKKADMYTFHVGEAHAVYENPAAS